MKLPQPLLDAQDRLAAGLGCPPDRRATIFAAMLHRGTAEITGYWIQLVIAAGIATLGLALGSNAVIIGAMLVAPLMGPIVGLGMGLATGSPVLVVRATGRVLVSLVVVGALSAGLTRLLPFHEINAEIAGRTTPTALDLGIAVFCAMAGVFATMRPASDVATTAAGTSIGISLVPPLCVAGYGVGTASWNVAYGAALLFFTNFAAIVLVGSVAFALVGFAQVDVQRLETEELRSIPSSWLANAYARRGSSALRAFGGPWLRMLMPVALLAALYSPLRRGLDDIAWQINARDRVETAIASLPHRVVQARVHVERERIEIVIFLLGAQEDAASVKDKLVKDLSALGLVPSVEVFAVPDSTEFEALERSTQPPTVPVVVPATTQPPVPAQRPADVVADAKEVIVGAVESRWPRAAGRILRVDLEAQGDELVSLRVSYLGTRLEDATVETLTEILSEDLGAEVELVAVDVPRSIALVPLDPASVAEIASYLSKIRTVESMKTCVRLPPRQPRRLKPASDESARDVLEAILAAQPRVTRLEEGEAGVWFTDEDCTPIAAQESR